MLNKKRSKLVVEPAIQNSLVRQLICQWTLHLLAAVLLLTMLELLLGCLFHPWQYHVERLWPLVGSLTVTMLFLAPVFILCSLKLSNRFAGPIHRFRIELRELAAGKTYKPLAFRGDDYWKEIADEFDQAIQAISRPANTVDVGSVYEQPQTGVVFPPTAVGASSDVTSTDASST